MLSVYKDKLDSIKQEVTTIGEQVLRANEFALKALEKNDTKLFTDARNELMTIAQTSNKIDNLIVTTLALHSPEAKDLRELVSYLKITNELVRSSDNTKSYIKSIAKTINHDIELSKINEYALPLHRSAILATKTALEIIQLDNTNDIEDYFHKVIVEETKTDDLYAMIEKNILKMITKNRELSKDYFDMLGSFRRLEKVADRAASIANLLLYAHVGGEINQA
ncbi:MAG: phosphate signaling complex PhoU family protein [Candidatus Marinarcus sp.]|uniref:phosphate signaling complex PhoU family protein n=1 Tax=Candidatus Marinarcus sp. TaxID=3100987 RepID=UPI003AFFB588